MTTLSTILILQKITTEAIIAFAALTVLAVAICYIIRIGRKECEMIFESDYDNLRTFIKECHINEETELRIRLRLIHLSKYPGADQDKLNDLNFDFEYRFLEYFIHHCPLTDESESKIISDLARMTRIKGADKEKLQVLNTEFRRKFEPPTLSDVVADHESN